MITGWGAHHIDVAHWAMGWENSGPLSVEGKGIFPTTGLWDVHGDYNLNYIYPGEVKVQVWNKFPNGVRFIGEKGWIFVCRGGMKATSSDPNNPSFEIKALETSDPLLLDESLPSNAISLYKNVNPHHQNWIDCIRSRKETIVSAEAAHRSTTACHLGYIAMKTGQKIVWDSKNEKITNMPELNSYLKLAERAPYGTRLAYEKFTKTKNA